MLCLRGRISGRVNSNVNLKNFSTPHGRVQLIQRLVVSYMKAVRARMVIFGGRLDILCESHVLLNSRKNTINFNASNFEFAAVIYLICCRTSQKQIKRI